MSLKLLLGCCLFPALLSSQTFTGGGGLIPDDGSTIAFDIPVSTPNATIDTLNFGLESVCVNITHTWNSDLSLALRAPDGTVLPLFSGVGGDTDGFENTCLSSNAAASIFSAPHPFTGTFRPVGDMGTLNLSNLNPNGTWQLVILDTYAFADAGELFSWSITFGDNPCKPFPFFSSDLPIVKINTGGQAIVNDPKINALMSIVDNGPGQRNFVQQTTAAFSGPVGIEIRGNSSQSFPKKSYGVETRDSLGEDLEVSLLGMPATSDFVLGANFSDKTLMRNALTFDLTRQLGHYASRTRFCELLVDGTYQGVYVLTEKIKRGKDRIDIAKLTETDVEGVALTGGYIVKIDWSTSPGWFSQFSQPNGADFYTYFQNEYPKADKIDAAQQGYILLYVDSFEVALAGNDFQHPVTGWRHFADEQSFMDYLFINELSKNVDGYRLSTFFYKDRDDRDGRLKMGAPWDYDLAWHNSDYCENWTAADWAYDINYVCPPGGSPGGVPFWWERLMEDTSFQQNAACRWQALRATTLHRDAIFARIDSMAAVVSEAQTRNFTLWPILGVYVWPNPGPLPDTYLGEVQKMKDWITDRLEWLDFAFGANLPVLNAQYDAVPLNAFVWQFTADNPAHGQVFAWDFGDGSLDTAQTLQHTFSGTGTYKVRLTVSTPFGCSNSSEQIFHIVNTSTYGIAQGNLSVAPNPVTDFAEITLPEGSAMDDNLLITNAIGQLCGLPIERQGNKITVDFRRQPAGVYAIRWLHGQRIWTAQVVVR